MLPDFFKFLLSNKVLYGEGLVSRLGEELEYLGPKKALLVTDKVLVKTGLVDKLKKGLEGSKITIAATYDDIPPNSELEAVTQTAEAGKAAGCDLIIALGGGSVLDTAKVANILMTKGGKVQDHMGAQLVQEKLIYAVFIPTTAGTGSEVTQFAVVLDKENQMKLPFQEEAIIPDVAILDPEMTKTMPGKLTAATGIDALTHAIESYVSNQTNPVTEALSLQAIEMISANILQACARPDDLQARGAMLVASLLAGVAFSHSGVGIVHAVSHALGGVYHIPHGIANSIMLPIGIEYNMEAAAPRYARIAEAMGALNLNPVGEISKNLARLKLDSLNKAIDNISFVDDWVMQMKAQSLPEKIRELNRKLKALTGLPTNLAEAGINDDLAKIETLIQHAMDDGSHLYNPVPISREGVEEMVVKALRQDLQAWEVTEADFKAARLRVVKKRPKDVFKDKEEVYKVIVHFFEMLRDHEVIGPQLLNSDLIVRFNYTEPDSSVLIDASGSQVKLATDDEARAGSPEVEMTMKADFAHYFWHGKANLLQALTRREVVTKGNLPRALRLLPILEPAYLLYPQYLKDNGYSSIVVE